MEFKDQLYKRNQFYVRKCEVNKMRGDRLESQKNHIKTIKTMGNRQMNKYFTVLKHLILNKKIEEATQKTVFLSNYMKKIHNKSNAILDVIYQSFGVAQYLSFQDINEWTEQKNHQRMLVFLGATKDVSVVTSVLIIESLFGRYDPHPKYCECF